MNNQFWTSVASCDAAQYGYNSLKSKVLAEAKEAEAEAEPVTCE